MFGNKRLSISRASIASKIMMSSLLSILILSALSVGISFYMSYSLLKQKNIEINTSALKQDISNVENILSKAEMYISTFLEDETFNESLAALSSNPSTEQYERVKKYMDELHNSFRELEFYYLVTPSNMMITNDSNVSSRLNYDYLVGRMAESDGEYSWTYTNFEISAFSDSISLTQQLSHFSSGQPIGIATFTINNNYIKNFYRTSAQDGSSFFLLTPGFKPVLASPAIDPETMSRLHLDASNTNEGHLVTDDMTYVYQKSPYTGWIGVKSLDNRLQMIPIISALKKSLVVFVMCILVSIAIGNRYTAAFRRSINSIRKGMTQVSMQNLNVCVKSHNKFHWSYRNSLLLLFGCSIFLPIVVSIVFAYSQFTKALRDETIHNFSNTQYALKSEITSNIESYEQAAHYLTFNSSIQAAVQDHYSSQNLRMSQSNDIDRIIMKQQRIRSGAFYVNVVDNNKQNVYSSIPLTKEALNEHFGTMDSLGQVKHFFETRKDYYNRYVITLGKRVFDIQEPDRILGYLFLSMYEKDICDLYNKYLSANIMNTFIIDKNGTIISENKKELIGKNIKAVHPDMNWPSSYTNSGSFTRMSGGKQYLMNYSTMGNLDWVLVNTVLIDDFLENRIWSVNLYIIFASFAAVVLLSFLMAQTIVKPLQKLKQSIHEVAMGDLDKSVILKSGNEIEELSRNFNMMVDQLRSLIQEAYVSRIEKQHLEIKRKEAELLAFQAQIQPHFLYNTLEVIHCKAMFITEGENEVSLLITRLADFLRFVTGDASSFIPLKDEIEHSANYIIIMQSCDYDFEVDWRIDSRLLEWRTPRLVLQPILENAINHGLHKGFRKNGKIVIAVRERQGMLQIRVVDNGSGIERSKLEKLRAGLRPQAQDTIAGEHIGLNNVHQRIALSFGMNYGIRIASRTNKGTVITMTMPRVLPNPVD